MYALVPQNAELSLSFLQMHQGYHKDADRLNSQLDLYAENPRYQNLFIDLVRNDTGKKYTVFSPCYNIKSWGGVNQCRVYTSLIFRPHMKGKFKRVKTRTLGPSIRNVEAINSTRNRISQRKVFHFLLHRRSNILPNICFLYRIRRFIRVYKYTKINQREITSLPESKSVMNMARHFNHPPK